MTPEQKDRVRKLVDTLRTTKKKQGQGALAEYVPSQKKVKYCCLGIACEVAMAEGLELQRTKVGLVYRYGTSMDGSSVTLPKIVREWYGFDMYDPTLIDENGREQNASWLNDDLHYNFKRIADAFERTYLSE